jgi:hypothetical protein
MGDREAEAPGTEVYRYGRSARVRAAPRRKPEPASKALMRGASRPDNGEDQWHPGRRTEAPGCARRGIRRSTYPGHPTQRGRSAPVPSVTRQLPTWGKWGRSRRSPYERGSRVTPAEQRGSDSVCATMRRTPACDLLTALHRCLSIPSTTLSVWLVGPKMLRQHALTLSSLIQQMLFFKAF